MTGPDGANKPLVIGHYTNDIVYNHLAPGVLNELKKVNPKTPKGRRASKHHQWFTPDFGHLKLKDHITGVTAFMRVARKKVKAK